MKRLFWCCLLAAIITKPSTAQDVPQWVREAAGCTIPAFGPKTAGVVLLAEKRVVVEPDGRVITTTRYATRFLSREARSRNCTSRLPHGQRKSSRFECVVVAAVVTSQKVRHGS